jgi:hypothetical protein
LPSADSKAVCRRLRKRELFLASETLNISLVKKEQNKIIALQVRLQGHQMKYVSIYDYNLLINLPYPIRRTFVAKMTQTFRAHRCEMNRVINQNFEYVQALLIYGV